MRIRLGYDIITRHSNPTPTVLCLHPRPELSDRFVTPPDLNLDPMIPVQEYTDSFGNRCVRLVAPQGPIRYAMNAIIEDDGEPDPVDPNAIQHRIEDLPTECLQFLLASRYCEVDRLSSLAWEKFGQTPLGWARAQAVSDFAHKHITFGYGYASSTKTAYDVLQEGRGVCRDFQHLAVALTRALGIPARYATGWIGDIRVTPSPGAMDFSAWYQVYLGGKWWDFDARYNTPRIGRTLMAVGRDAADVALITSFGPHALDKFEVVTTEVSDDTTS